MAQVVGLVQGSANCQPKHKANEKFLRGDQKALSVTCFLLFCASIRFCNHYRATQSARYLL